MSANNYPLASAEYIKAKKLVEETGEEAGRLPALNRKIQSIRNAQAQNKKYDKAETYYYSKNYEAAENILNEILGANSNHSTARTLLSRVRNDKAAYEKAVASKKKPVKIPQPRETVDRSTPIGILLKEAESLYLNEKYSEARKKFLVAKEIDPSNRKIQGRLKEIEYSLGIEYINDGIELYFNGNLQDCRKYFEDAVIMLENHDGFSGSSL